MRIVDVHELHNSVAYQSPEPWFILPVVPIPGVMRPCRSLIMVYDVAKHVYLTSHGEVVQVAPCR